MDGDGDGVPDLLISAYRSDERGVNRGKFGFFSGSELGAFGVRSVGSAELQIHGEANGDKLAHSVKWAGDVDGDGIAEALTGSAYHSATGHHAGRAYLIPGTVFAQQGDRDIAETNAIAWDGETAEERLGQLTEPLGDIDGDGLADFSFTALRSQANGVGTGELEFRGSGIVTSCWAQTSRPWNRKPSVRERRARSMDGRARRRCCGRGSRPRRRGRRWAARLGVGAM